MWCSSADNLSRGIFCYIWRTGTLCTHSFCGIGKQFIITVIPYVTHTVCLSITFEGIKWICACACIKYLSGLFPYGMRIIRTDKIFINVLACICCATIMRGCSYPKRRTIKYCDIFPLIPCTICITTPGITLRWCCSAVCSIYRTRRCKADTPL